LPTFDPANAAADCSAVHGDRSQNMLGRGDEDESTHSGANTSRGLLVR
jgi:hypothetical protein